MAGAPTSSSALAAQDPGYPFTGARQYPTDLAVAATADLDRNGSVDLILDSGSASALGPVAVALGRGDGTFRPIETIVRGSIGDSLVGDFGGDRAPDLAIASAAGKTITASVLLGDGSGRFSLASSRSLPRARSETGPGYLPEIDAGDFDDDADLDLLVRGPSSVASIRWQAVALARPVRTEVPPPPPASDGERPYAIEAVGVGDFDEDGREDLAVEQREDLFGDSALTVLSGRAGGRFGVSGLMDGTGGSDDLSVADLNGDGRLDLLGNGSNAVASHANLIALRGDGDGHFRDAPQRLAEPSVFTVPAIADFDRDGDADVVASLTGGPLNYFRGRGARGFDPPVRERSEASLAIGRTVGADFNDDGRTDVAIARGGNLEILLNDPGPDNRGRGGNPELELARYRCAGADPAQPVEFRSDFSTLSGSRKIWSKRAGLTS